MSSIETLVKLANVAQSQNGYVTSLDAKELGVSRSQLAKLSAVGALHSVSWGVYRVAGAPGAVHEEIYANFLALWRRTRNQNGIPGLVVAGESATLLHGIGGYWGNTVELITQGTFSTRRQGVEIERAPLLPRDVATVEGMPTLNGNATIADLVRRGGDWSIIADALMDGLQFSLVDVESLPDALERIGRVPDGVSVARALLESMKLPQQQILTYVQELRSSERVAA